METVLIVGAIWSVLCIVFLWINYRFHQYGTTNVDRRGLVPQVFVETEDEQKVTTN
jgi:hypothetical protein